MVANMSKRYTLAAGLSSSVPINSNAPLSKSGSARPRSVFNAEIADHKKNIGLAFTAATATLVLTVVCRSEFIRQH